MRSRSYRTRLEIRKDFRGFAILGNDRQSTRSFSSATPIIRSRHSKIVVGIVRPRFLKK
jgi:hypothetical protein